MVNTVPSASDRSGENAGETLILTIINAGGPCEVVYPLRRALRTDDWPSGIIGGRLKGHR
jgi:hypothetical protein